MKILINNKMDKFIFLDIDGVLNSKEVGLTEEDVNKAIKILSNSQ